jgi:SMC interacting uncharacterized protein involved in chromosome segregation
MSNKPNNVDTSGTISTSTEDFKDQSVKHNFSKFEHDLYHEEDDVALPVVRVKRISLPNKGDKWKIFEDNKVVFIIEGSKLLKKEREYLQTIEGFNFILAKAKAGIKSLHAFRTELKKVIDKPQVQEQVVVKPKRGRPPKSAKKSK